MKVLGGTAVIVLASSQFSFDVLYRISYVHACIVVA